MQVWCLYCNFNFAFIALMPLVGCPEGDRQANKKNLAAAIAVVSLRQLSGTRPSNAECDSLNKSQQCIYARKCHC